MKADASLYGKGQILRNKTGSMFIRKKINITSNKQMKKILKKVEYVKEQAHPNICHIVKYEQDETQMLCANFTNLNLVFEFYENNLQNQVLERWDRYNKYNDKQLLQIMKEILLPLEYLHANNMTHGDIRGYNIFIDNSNAKSKKISCIPCFFPESSQYYQFLNNFVRPKLCTLAPEQLNSLKYHEIDPKFDLKKADVFQAGFCILQTAALTSCARVYDWYKYKTNKEELDGLINKISKHYSKSLIDIIKSLLILDPEQRPTLTMIKTQLNNPNF